MALSVRLPDLSINDALGIYRNRDVIEKNFVSFKNRLDFRRMRTHWNETTEGKMFIGFLALTLLAYMLRAIKNNPLTKNLALGKVFIELRKIRMVSSSDSSEALIPLTKLQKTILSVLRVPHELL
jgi:transposase